MYDMCICLCGCMNHRDILKPNEITLLDKINKVKKNLCRAVVFLNSMISLPH